MLLRILYYPWYILRTCDCCGRKFYRIREQSIYQDILSLFQKQNVPKGTYACCMGCAISIINKDKARYIPCMSDN